MSKFIFKFLTLIFIALFSILIFLSYFGLETDKFDELIKGKTKNLSSNIKLDFNKTKTFFDIRGVKLLIKLQEPKVILQGNKINLSKFDLSLPLKSFYRSNFILEKVRIGFSKNKIQDLTKVTNIFLPTIINKKLKKTFSEGNLEGEFLIYFNLDGSINENITFNGKIKEATINLPNDYKIKNFSTEIGYEKSNKIDILKINIKSAKISNINFSESLIKIEFKEKNKVVKSTLKTSGNINYQEVKKIFSILNIKDNFLEDVNLTSNLITNISFDINDKFKILNTSYGVKGNIKNLNLKIKKKKMISTLLPDFNSIIIFKDIKIDYLAPKGFNKYQDLELSGNVNFDSSFEEFKYKQNYKGASKKHYIDFTSSLNESSVEFKQLNYKKKSGQKANINLKSNFIIGKYYLISSLLFDEGESEIKINDVKFNNDYQITNLKKLKIKTYIKDIKNNDFFIEKEKSIIILGEIFDAQPLLRSLFEKNDKQTFGKKFNSEVKINFNKVIAGDDDDVNDLSVVANINSGSYNKLSLKGNFSDNEIIEMSIYKTGDSKKTLQVISDRARPFIKHFNFIEGFEGGKLEYEATIFNTHTDANLLITDFKVSKVPSLAKLLTLASLQGIADTLSGEGIRFDVLEMKSKTKDNILTIEDTLAMGPAVSILLDGYIDKGKVVSLRGTLVPATKLNSIIAKIPLVGNILVGKKTGEGVVGVSFKMKGPPNDIKTSVNPIKTLTPRFIVRAIEKIKKNKKEDN